ncbi:MAG: T9SS type A sorting domain-containing protein, partial [Paludibacter sp.]
TVEMWSKAYTDANYHWQYFGIPVTGTTFASTFSGTGVRVRKYDETNHDATGNNVGLWKPSGTGNSYSGTDALVPVDGYEVTQPSARKYTFTGTLYHSDVTKTLAYTASADWKGQHILANPFTAALDISKLTFGAGTENNVYLYNAGSLAEWTAASGASTDGTSPGQYTVSNGEFAGTLGTPKQIPSMQGFLVNVTSTSSFGMPLSALISNSIVQRAPAVSNKVGTRIDVVGTKYADKMWIFTESTATRSYDKGFDGPKLLGSALTPQLYAMESDGIYQIDAVKDINNTQLGFQAGSEKNLKLVFTHQNSELYSKIYLVDLVANKTVDVTASGSEYAFTSEATPTAVNRFKIISTTEVTTSTNNIKNDDLRIMNQDNKLIIDNKLADNGTLQIFDLAGKLQTSFHFDGNAISTLNSTLQKGIYVARMSAGSYSISKSLIIK